MFTMFGRKNLLSQSDNSSWHYQQYTSWQNQKVCDKTCVQSGFDAFQPFTNSKQNTDKIKSTRPAFVRLDSTGEPVKSDQTAEVKPRITSLMDTHCAPNFNMFGVKHHMNRKLGLGQCYPHNHMHKPRWQGPRSAPGVRNPCFPNQRTENHSFSTQGYPFYQFAMAGVPDDMSVEFIGFRGDTQIINLAQLCGKDSFSHQRPLAARATSHKPFTMKKPQMKSAGQKYDGQKCNKDDHLAESILCDGVGKMSLSMSVFKDQPVLCGTPPCQAEAGSHVLTDSTTPHIVSHDFTGIKNPSDSADNTSFTTSSKPDHMVVPAFQTAEQYDSIDSGFCDHPCEMSLSGQKDFQSVTDCPESQTITVPSPSATLATPAKRLGVSVAVSDEAAECKRTKTHHECSAVPETSAFSVVHIPTPPPPSFEGAFSSPVVHPKKTAISPQTSLSLDVDSDSSDSEELEADSDVTFDFDSDSDDEEIDSIFSRGDQLHLLSCFIPDDPYNPLNFNRSCGVDLVDGTVGQKRSHSGKTCDNELSDQSRSRKKVSIV